jgi:hypothetical protein
MLLPQVFIGLAIAKNKLLFVNAFVSAVSD